MQLHQLFKVTFKSKIIINNREMLNMRRCIFITILLVIFIVNTYPLLKTIHRSYSKLMLSMNSEKITIQPITSFTGRVRIYLYAYMIWYRFIHLLIECMMFYLSIHSYTVYNYFYLPISSSIIYNYIITFW